MLAVAARGGHIGHIQDQLALGVDGDGRFEPIEALRLAFAAMTHLGIGDADDPIRCGTFTDLRLAMLIADQVVAQDLGQQPAGLAHFAIIGVLTGDR